MYNLCIFIFIIYAMSYSVSEILLKQKRHTVPVSKRKSHTVKNSKPKHKKSRNIKSATHTRQTAKQIKPNNKKKTSYKKPNPRTGRKPVRGLLYGKTVINSKNINRSDPQLVIIHYPYFLPL